MSEILTIPEQYALAQSAFQTGDEASFALMERIVNHPLFNFQPRPDAPDDWDEQTAALNDDEHGFVVLMGGTGSGKTITMAHKTARYVLETKPPRPRTPFWIVGATYEMVCGVCWDEKLSTIIPEDQIEHRSWIDAKRRWPSAVMLKPWPDGSSWVLEFKAYAQGEARFQARSIGGYWFNEIAPMSIVDEVQGRCRDYNSPGWADFTPLYGVDPKWQEKYDKPPEGWKFYHLNVERNEHIDSEWTKKFLEGVPDDLRDTRRIGTFSSQKGQIFKEWRRTEHICEPNEVPMSYRRFRAIDFGHNNAFVCLWFTRDAEGRYWVYRELYAKGWLNSKILQEIKRQDPWDSPLCGPTFSDWDAQQRAEMNAGGVPCTMANKSIHPSIELIRSLMAKRGVPNAKKPHGRPMLQVSRSCEHLIAEIGKYRWANQTGSAFKIGSQRNAPEQPVDFENDTVDALRYGILTDHGQQGGTAPQSIKREWVPKKSLRFQKPDKPRRER